MKKLFYIFIFVTLLKSTYGQTNETIKELLVNPFDLQKFKKVKGSSNSGGVKKKSYYLKPKSSGIYYSFFLFHPTSNNREIEGSTFETGLDVTTFKPSGKYQSKYLDLTETIIEVIEQYNDKDLPELAFIGMDTILLKKKIGNDFIKKNNCFIYSDNSNVLLFKVSGNSVIWLKYIRLNLY